MSDDPQIDKALADCAAFERKRVREYHWELLLCALVVVGLCFAVGQYIQRAWDETWWTFLHATGSDNPSGVEYGFWSGFGSFVPFVVPVTAWYWAHTCHIGTCPWPARHEYEMNGVKHKLCHKHHPNTTGKRLSHQDVLDHAESVR